MDRDKIMARAKQKVTDDEIVDVFEESSDPYLTASEVASKLGNMSRQGVHARLLDLYERGVLNRKKTGRAVGWWLKD